MPPFLEDRSQQLAYLQQMIRLWRRSDEGTREMTPKKQAVNIPLLIALAEHVAELSEGMVTLCRADQDFAAMPLIRSSMESAMTAAYLSVAPDKTHSFMHETVTKRAKALRAIAKTGNAEAAAALEDANTLLLQLHDDVDQEARTLYDRFCALDGGEALYLTYRALCGLCHPSDILADRYLQEAPQSPDNPLGVVRFAHGRLETPEAWIGTQVCMLIVAQIAVDCAQAKRTRKTQLDNAAKRYGITNTIRLKVDTDA